MNRLAQQTLKNFEVILVCDGGDADYEICCNFVALDKRFKLISNIQKGPGGARNAGIDQSLGSFIYFCDADDMVDIDCCEKMLAPLIDNPKIGFTACSTEIQFDGIEDFERKKQDDLYFAMPPSGIHEITQETFGKLNVGLWNKVYRKDIIDKFNIRFPEKTYNEDAYFNWCYWAVCGCFCSITDVKYYYVRRSGSLMNQTFNKTLGKQSLDHLKVAVLFYDFLQKYGIEKKYKTAFWNSYLVSYWFSKCHTPVEWQHKVKQMVMSFLSDHELPKEKKYKELEKVMIDKESNIFKKVYGKNNHEVAITAVLPVYNCEQYLHRCIDSVLSQTLNNIEIILAVDGGETCYRICDEYAEKDSRIRVIRDKGSYGKSVNAGIIEARGEYISIIECDDWCEPDMFQVLYTAAKHYEADVVKGGWFDSFDNKLKNKPRLYGYPDGFINIYEHQDFFASQPSVWSAIYRKEYLIQNDIFFFENRQSFVDAPFHYKTLYCTEDYVLINKPLYHYYQDNPNQSVQCNGNVYDGINAEKFAYMDIMRYPGLWQKIGQGIFAAMLEHLRWNDRRILEKAQHDEFIKAATNFLSDLDLKDINFDKISNESFELLQRLQPNIKRNSVNSRSSLSPEPKYDRFIFRLFGFIPLFSIERQLEFTKVKLFTWLNIISIKRNVSTIRLYLFKFIPLFVIRRK